MSECVDVDLRHDSFDPSTICSEFGHLKLNATGLFSQRLTAGFNKIIASTHKTELLTDNLLRLIDFTIKKLNTLKDSIDEIEDAFIKLGKNVERINTGKIETSDSDTDIEDQSITSQQ